jgi:hypothetical protein
MAPLYPKALQRLHQAFENVLSFFRFKDPLPEKRSKNNPRHRKTIPQNTKENQIYECLP